MDERCRAKFAAAGLLRLPGFVPAETVGRARDAVLRAVSRTDAGARLWRDGAWQLDTPPADAPINAGAKLVKGANRARAIADVFAPALRRSIEDLLDGRAVREMSASPALLFTLPNATTWTVPPTIWHLDMPRLPTPGIAGVQAFVFLDAVEPGAGGTLVVKGSHRLLNDCGFVRSKQVKKLLKRQPWFGDLMNKQVTDRRRFLQTSTVDGVPVQVVELHGKPGDVVLTDLRLLHTLAPNAGAAPRMMATQRYVLEEAWAQWQAIYTEGA